MNKNVCTVLILLFLLNASGGNLLRNGDFEKNGEGWWHLPAAASAVSYRNTGEDHGTALYLAPRDINAAVNSQRLNIGTDIHAERTYKVSARIRSRRITAGTFSASITFFKEDKNIAKQYSFFSRTAGSDQWENAEILFGNGTQMTFPPDAVEMVIRFSFWDKSGRNDGEVLIDHVSLRETLSPLRDIREADMTVKAPDSIRREDIGGHRYIWLEMEDLAPEDAYRGSWKYQKSWCRASNAMPNESGYASLVRPEWKNPATLKTAIPVGGRGAYHVFLRIGTFRPWGIQAVTVSLNGKPYRVSPEAGDPILSNAFSWVKINDAAIEIDQSLALELRNDIMPQNQTVLDCLLITDDPAYIPPKELPQTHRFSAREHTLEAAADVWHPAVLNSPVYVCRESSQQFLFRMRNFSPKARSGLILEITLPHGVTLEDPSRKLRWAGDGRRWSAPHFVHNSPDRFEHVPREEAGGKYHCYRLFFDRPFSAYDPARKTKDLFFLTLSAGDIKPGKYEITLSVGDAAGSFPDGRTIQALEILPELNAPHTPGFHWGVDAIYASLLSGNEQQKLLETFGKAGVNVWASRVREADPELSKRNREHWQLVRKNGRMKLINWGEFWWPGTPYTDESKNYVSRYPDKLGVWRNDDRGLSLRGKLICPEALLSGDDLYISEHMAKFTSLLRENGITEALEDVEYSSPLSYCFCPRCRQRFALENSLKYDEIANLTPDEFLKKHQSAWVDFRCRQNTGIVNKISAAAKKFYPEIRFKLFCGYQSHWVKQRYGVDWPALLKLPDIDGAFVGGGVPGTAAQITEMKASCADNRKEFISMANATLSFPNGYDELSGRTQAYLESRIIHDLMCGSGGIFIWWWGTLDGRCMKAFETGAKISAAYSDILSAGQVEYRKIGQNNDFYLITATAGRGRLVALVNPSRYQEDRVSDPEAVMALFADTDKVTNVLTEQKESPDEIRKRASALFRSGDAELWFIHSTN